MNIYPNKESMTRTALLTIVIVPIITACSAVTPTPVPPEEILHNAADRMTGTSGFRFSIDRSGAPAFLDSSNLFSLSRIQGDYIAPRDVQATARIVLPGVVTEVSFVAIGESQWQTNPLSGAWESLSPSESFNPALLFDPQVGLQAILDTDVSALELLENAEIDTLPGHALHHLTGNLAGEKTYEISYGLIGPGTMDMELWIEPGTYELHRMILIEGAEDPDNLRTWQIDFWDFDLEIVIQPPPS
jgi:lipoprotein LprG